MKNTVQIFGVSFVTAVREVCILKTHFAAVMLKADVVAAAVVVGAHTGLFVQVFVVVVLL